MISVTIPAVADEKLYAAGFGPAHIGDAGTDLRSAEEAEIFPMTSTTIHTGVKVAIPDGFVGLVFPRSGLACMSGINLANCVGVIDSGYRGEVLATLYNQSQDTFNVEKGMRICQLVIVPFAAPEFVNVDSLSETERGDGGYGSTGVM